MDQRELSKLREKCGKLTVENQELKSKILDLEQKLNECEKSKQKEPVGDEIKSKSDSEELKSLRDELQKLSKDYETVKHELEDSRSKVFTKDPNEVLDYESKDGSVGDDVKMDSEIERKIDELEDKDFKKSLKTMINKGILAEKAYQFAQMKWEESKKREEKVKDTKLDYDLANQDDIDVNSKDKKGNDEEPLANGDILLRAALSKVDSVISKAEKKVTKDEVKSFAANLSTKTNEGVLSIASVLIDQSQEFVERVEPEMIISVERIFKKEGSHRQNENISDFYSRKRERLADSSIEDKNNSEEHSELMFNRRGRGGFRNNWYPPSGRGRSSSTARGRGSFSSQVRGAFQGQPRDNGRGGYQGSYKEKSRDSNYHDSRFQKMDSFRNDKQTVKYSSKINPDIFKF